MDASLAACARASRLPFDEAVPLRMRAIEEFHRIFDLLYGAFLDIRLDADKWRKELKEIRRWVEKKAKHIEVAEE